LSPCTRKSRQVFFCLGLIDRQSLADWEEETAAKRSKSPFFQGAEFSRRHEVTLWSPGKQCKSSNECFFSLGLVDRQSLADWEEETAAKFKIKPRCGVQSRRRGMRGDFEPALTRKTREQSVFLVWDLVDRQSRRLGGEGDQPQQSVQNCCFSRWTAAEGVQEVTLFRVTT
jgi:hypothetical protein